MSPFWQGFLFLWFVLGIVAVGFFLGTKIFPTMNTMVGADDFTFGMMFGGAVLIAALIASMRIFAW